MIRNIFKLIQNTIYDVIPTRKAPKVAQRTELKRHEHQRNIPKDKYTLKRILNKHCMQFEYYTKYVTIPSCRFTRPLNPHSISRKK